MENFRALRRTVAFHAPGGHLPRITHSQWGALMSIERSGESTVRDVAKTLGVTSSAATQLVDGLVQSGYVQRQASPKDRRTVILTLTKKTKVQVDNMKKERLRKFLKFFEVLDDREFNQYIALNKKIVERLLKNKKK